MIALLPYFLVLHLLVMGCMLRALCKVIRTGLALAVHEELIPLLKEAIRLMPPAHSDWITRATYAVATKEILNK